MTHALVSRPGRSGRPTLVVRSADHGPLTLVPRRRLDTVLARLLGSALDRRLARGVAPEAGRLLAARAAWLTSPRQRVALAEAWEAVVDRACAPLSLADPRVPVARGTVLAARAEIAGLAAVLRAAGPVGAEGVALATVPLTDAASPVHVGGDLRSVVAALADRLTQPSLDPA